MKLSQKILGPTLAVFIAVLIGLFAYSYSMNQASNKARDNQSYQQAEKIFNAEIESQGRLALGLAMEAANDPSIQKAFSVRDRQRLTELTLNTYNTLHQQLDLWRYQYHLPPAIAFLQLQDLDKFGEDMSSYRNMVIDANNRKLPISGLELGRDSLGLWGVSPVFYNGQHIGSVEFGMNVDETFLKKLRAGYGYEWRILIRRASLTNIDSSGFVPFAEGPNPDLLLLAATDDLPYATTEFYDGVLAGPSNSINVHDDSNQNYGIHGFLLEDASDRTIGVVEVLSDLEPARNAQYLRILFGILAIATALAASSAILLISTRQALKPLTELNQSAIAIANGDFSQDVKITNEQDEIGLLGQAFHQMTSHVRTLVNSLEQNIKDRTRDLERRTRELETATRIAREITTQQHLDQLLANAANLIREEYNFYHVGIFLVDDLREYAILRASTGDAGRQMLAQNHRLKVGEVGIVGFVTETGRPRVALDVGSDVVHFRNPLLPDTRSEMALPLAYGGLIIGALDVQSNKESAFDNDDIKVIQTVADQLAIAITNARLSERTQENLRDLNTLYQEKIRRAWRQVSREKTTEFEYDGLNIAPVKQNLPPAQLAQLAEGKPISLKNTTIHSKAGRIGSTLLVPLIFQGQLIGTVGIEKDDPSYEWSQEELSVVENAATQASLALENARLLEETQRFAAKERTITEISARIGGLVDIDRILQTTVQELSQTLPEAEVAIQFERKDQE